MAGLGKDWIFIGAAVVGVYLVYKITKPVTTVTDGITAGLNSIGEFFTNGSGYNPILDSPSPQYFEPKRDPRPNLDYPVQVTPHPVSSRYKPKVISQPSYTDQITAQLGANSTLNSLKTGQLNLMPVNNGTPIPNTLSSLKIANGRPTVSTLPPRSPNSVVFKKRN